MDHYIRVFCTSEEVPSITSILEWAAKKGCNMRVASEFSNLNPDENSWRRVGIAYDENKSPFHIEVHDNSSDSILHQEVEEYDRYLKDFTDSADKKKALQHIHATRFIVANKIPTNLDDDGYLALGVFMTYFVQHCSGMILIDGEGLSEGIKQKLKIE